VFSKKDEVVLGFKIFKMRVKGLAEKAFKLISVNGAFGDFRGDNEADSGGGVIGGGDFQAKEGGVMGGFGVESRRNEITRKTISFRQHVRR